MCYFWNSQFAIPELLKINGKMKQLKFIDVADGSFVSEFTQICLYDCYHLADLEEKLNKVETIIDIGANQGLFLIAARQLFPGARITCYEPNRNLESSLRHNATQLNATVFYEAVMKEDCWVKLNFSDSDLATSAFKSDDGTVQGTAFQKVIERVGEVDILKMDCEGAEWELLENADAWGNVHSLALEYHLWAKPEMNIDGLFKLLANINFKVIYHTLLTADQGLVIAINKNH
jgi:FkbM family methyltransferase